MVRRTLIVIIIAYRIIGWPVRHTLMRNWVPTSARALYCLHNPGLTPGQARSIVMAAISDTKPPRPPLP